MSTTPIKELEEQMALCRRHIDVGRALARLMHNPDFRKVVLTGYLEKEAVRLVHARSQANAQGPFPQEINLRRIDAIGFFQQYLDKLAQDAESAAGQLVEDERTRDELLAEAGENS